MKTLTSTFKSVLLIIMLKLLISTASAQTCSAGYSFSVNVPAKTVYFTNTSSGSGLTYSWNFGDGNYSSLASPTHVYGSNGSYIVSLWIYKNDSSCYSLFTDTVQVGAPCDANFYHTIDPLNSRTYNFYNTSTGTSLVYLWDFGDGTFSSLPSPTHTYATNGPKTISMNIRNIDSSCFDMKLISIMVSGTPCTAFANFTFLTDSSNKNKIYFNNTSSVNNPAYIWNFGDGTFSTQASPNHIYPGPGVYQVCLTARNSTDSSCSDQYCTYVTITNPCTADFGFYADSLAGNLNKFHFTSFNTTPGLIYDWNFGDGYSSSLKNPVHQYATSGAYTVCLSIHNPADTFCNGYKCHTIYVGPSCNAAFSSVTDTLSNTVYFSNQTGGSMFSYSWTFGDGSSASSATNPVHTYSHNGAYIVCLEVRSFDTSCYDRVCDTIYIGPHGGGTCQAAFNSTRDALDYNVYFMNRSYSKPGVIYSWSFGDGSTSSLRDPVHHYTQNGAYRVCLQISTYDSSCTASVCDTILITRPINDTTCHADFVFAMDSINSGMVHFTNTSSTAPLMMYRWNFGTSFGTNPNPTVTFPAVGIYLVTLTITNLQTGCTSTITKQVTVTNAPNCHASFTTVATGNRSIRFQGSSFGPNATYLWYFGDGASSNLQWPTHTYSQAGAYQVLFIAMSGSCFDSTSMMVYVNPGCDASFTAFEDSSSNGIFYFSPAYTASGTSYLWNFPNGGSSTLKYPSHDFSHSGNNIVCLTITNRADSCSATYCDTVLWVNSHVGMKEVNTVNVNNAYPVPFTDELNLDIFSPGAARAKLIIMDITGKTLLEKNVSLQKEQNSISLDVKDLSKGIYFIEILSEYGNTIKKISK